MDLFILVVALKISSDENISLQFLRIAPPIAPSFHPRSFFLSLSLFISLITPVYPISRFLVTDRNRARLSSIDVTVDDFNLCRLCGHYTPPPFLDRRNVHVSRSNEIANKFSGREIASSTDTR